MAVDSGAGRAKGICERQSQIKLELGVIAATLTNVSGIPAGLFLLTLCHEHWFHNVQRRQKAEQGACDFWMEIKLIWVYLLI